MDVPRLPTQGIERLRRRGAWEIQRGVLFALLLREMKARVGGQWIGAVWTLIEPLAHTLILVSIYVAISGGRSFGGVEYPVFLVTGLIPFFLFQNLANRLMDSIDANRGLFAYRQVKPIDTMASRACVEAIMNMLVYGFTLTILGWLGYHVVPARLLEVFGVQLLMVMTGASFGIFAAVVSHDRPRLRSAIRMIMLPLYIASGVMFPVHFAPADVVSGLLYNPLMHLVELSRHAFIADYRPIPGVGLMYPLMFALTLMTLALMTYRADRLRLVTTS